MNNMLQLPTSILGLSGITVERAKINNDSVASVENEFGICYKEVKE